MNGRSTRNRYAAVVRWASGALVLLTVFTGLTAWAARPVDPLPTPLYSFDLPSPTTDAGLVGAPDILTLGQDGESPAVLVAGAQLGLIAPNDELDALSGPNAAVPPLAPFALLFSVDRATVGVALPDPLLIAHEVPYNVTDQVSRGHAAGDMFMALLLLTRDQPLAPKGGGSTNNVLVVNNFDEGGTDFGGEPPTHARDNVTGVDEDNVDATAQDLGGGGKQLGGVVTNVYFTLTAESPSLPFLSGGLQPSGAHVFYNPEPGRGGDTTLFAGSEDLGLAVGDEIDALIVFDMDVDGLFNAGDLVFFSLAPGSPSFAIIPDVSDSGEGADVFAVSFGKPPRVLVNAAEFGLGNPGDNIDALDLTGCTDAPACSADFGIRAVRGDWNDDAVVTLDDFVQWPLCMTGPGAGPGLFGCGSFDFDSDTDIDLDDFSDFQEVFAISP